MLKVWQRTIVNDAGDTLPSAELDVFLAGTTTRADIFQDKEGTTPLTNPFNADIEGFAQFFIDDGYYDIEANLGGTTGTWTNVIIGQPYDNSSSGVEGSNSQEAIDYLDNKLSSLDSSLTNAITNISNPSCHIDTQNGNINVINGVGGATYERVQATDGSTTSVNTYGELEYYNNDQPRRSANGGTLLEPQATNMLPYSDMTILTLDIATNVTDTTFPQFSNGIQIPNSATLSIAYQDATTVNGTTYTISYFVIMDDASEPQVSSGTTTGDFSLVVGGDRVVTINPAVLIDSSNNMYKVSATHVSDAGSIQNGLVRYDTQSGKGFKVVGHQLETGSIATSYIPTTTTALTRSRDTLKLQGKNNIPSMLGDSQFTIHSKFILGTENILNDYFTIWDINDGANDNFRLMQYSTQGIRFASDSTGMPSVVVESNPTPNTIYDVKFVADGLNYRVYLNGIEIINATATNGWLVNQVQDIWIGSTSGIAFEFFGEILLFETYNYAMTAEQARL